MRILVKHVFAAGLAVAVIGAGLAATQPVSADMGAVKERQATFKKISKANKAIKKAAKAGDKSAAMDQAKMIVGYADRLAGLFPKGTDRGMLGKKATRAKPEIWSDWDTFKQKLGDLRGVAVQVAGGDLAAAKGMGKRCGACHKLFRGKKVKKKKM
ncbi:MAG: cytochrome c [Rhodospirillaceae bacterium]|jgi:cytochrome c556|nr:cytochrome c [Rhodospirillaceae bacterium]MBT5459212.1 cytochrome c [Rhodospirillaceae bacterium]